MSTEAKYGPPATGDPEHLADADEVARRWQHAGTAAVPAELPSDQPRPAQLSRDRHSADVDVRPLDTFSIEACDNADIVVALWAVLVSRSTDQTSFVIAEHGVERNVGSLIEIDIDRDASLHRLVSEVSAARTRNATDGAFDFDRFASAMGVDGHTDRNPICSTAIGPHAASDGGSLPMPDIELSWTIEFGALTALSISGSADLFTSERVERLALQFEALLDAAVAAPEAPLNALAWLPAGDVSLIESWQGRTLEHGDTQFGRRFGVVAAEFPDRAAIEFGESSWSYAELDRWSNRLARHLRANGVGHDDIVAIRMDRSIELVASILAVLKSGGAYLPIDPTYPANRQRFLLHDSAVSVILTDAGVADSTDVATTAMSVILVDDADADFHQLDAEPITATGDGTELGYVIYTSGSTGAPKAVGLPVRALANLIDWQLDLDDFAPGLRTLQFSSPSFDVSFQEIMATLLSAGTLVLIDDTLRRDPRALLDHLVTHRVERLFAPNVALRGLAEVATADADAVATLALREVYTAGEQLRIDTVMRALFAALPDCRLANQYGPSETHVSTAHQLPADVATWPTLPPIGSPIANSTAEVLDAEGKRCLIGAVGELWLGGRCLARGYLGNESATASKFLPDPFRSGEMLYRSGDRARWNEQGELEYHGRLDDQVKFRGFRIEPAEVAVVLSGESGVGQCYVAVRDLGSIGSRLVAYVKLTDPSTSMVDLRLAAADVLPEYMVPSHFVEVESLPLTASGKVDVAKLPVPTFDRRSLTTDYVAPSTPIEFAIVEMWQALMGTDAVGVSDDFFDLGGDSLMAVELFSMLRERFGVELPLGALAADPTVAALAGEVERASSGTAEFSVIVPIRSTGSRRPFFSVHGGSGNVASFPRLARLLDADQPFYGLQWPGLGSSRFPRTMSSLAAEYIEAIKTVQPEGPYALGGQCIGGLLAQEMSKQLTEAGEAVDLVVMYDSPMIHSPAFHAAGSLPPAPAPLRPLLVRCLSGAVAAMRFAKGVSPRKQMAQVRLRSALRRRVPMVDQFVHATIVMTALAWKHQPPQVPVKTVLVHSAESNAAMLAFTGRWSDGMLGWQHRVGSHFEAHHVPGTHNELLYSPEAVVLLRELLDARD